MDIEDIRKYYEKMSNGELISIVTTKARSLRPEVFDIIEKEIEKRNLNPSLLKGALAQNKEYSLEEIKSYAEFLRVLPCSICRSSKEKLNGTIIYTVISFVLFSSYGAEPIIACPDCLDKKNKNAIISTVLLGWWGIPWGFLKTPLYIYRNYKAKKENRLNIPNRTLLAYVLKHIGEIEAYKDNEKMLENIIKPL